MRAKVEALSLAVLRDFAKDKGVKNVSTMKKSDLIDAIIAAAGQETLPKKENKSEENARPDVWQ